MKYQNTMEITFWGTRGSVPSPGKDTVKYGGNTPCVEVRTPSLTIFDSGTGIRGLGKKLIKEKTGGKWGGKGIILITHHHWDHIQGFNFFDPVYDGKNKFTIYGKYNIKEALRGQMKGDYFPGDWNELEDSVSFRKIVEGQKVKLPDDFVIMAYALNHPNGCLGYRIESPNGKALAYITDHEYGKNKELDENVYRLAQGADVLIIDSQYTPKEYKEKEGWGHSTGNMAVKVGKKANVKKLVLFHHDPERTDRQLDRIVKEAQKEFENTIAAEDGLTLDI